MNDTILVRKLFPKKNYVEKLNSYPRKWTASKVANAEDNVSGAKDLHGSLRTLGKLDKFMEPAVLGYPPYSLQYLL